MDLRPAAEVPHRLAELRLDDRVDDDRRPTLRAVDDEAEVVDGLDARVPDLLEGLLGELRLERGDEPRGGLAGRVRDDVELDRHGGGASGVTTSPRTKADSFAVAFVLGFVSHLTMLSG